VSGKASFFRPRGGASLPCIFKVAGGLGRHTSVDIEDVLVAPVRVQVGGENAAILGGADAGCGFQISAPAPS
jgi:hypothetical protein